MPRPSRRSKTPSWITSANISCWTSGWIRPSPKIHCNVTCGGKRLTFIIQAMKRNFLVRPGVIALAALSFQNLLADDFPATTAPVGRSGDALITPVNQIVMPAGAQVELPGLRPQALALSPDEKLLVTAGITHELVAVDPATGKNFGTAAGGFRHPGRG